VQKCLVPALCIALSSIIAAPALAQDNAPAQKHHAKNIILMIGDGMGYNQVAAGDMYQYGKTGAQVYEKFKQYPVSTYPAKAPGYDPQKAWSDFAYVKRYCTDSAAAATAMATGVSTYNGAIGVGTEKQPLKQITELAEEKGKAVGDITTVLFNHATPACFLSHDRSRGNYTSIAKEMLNRPAEVIMGAGHPGFDKDGKPVKMKSADPSKGIPGSYGRVGGEDIWKGLKAGTFGNDCDGDGKPDPWTLIDTKAQFEALMHGKTPKRVFGLLPVQTTLQEERSGDAKADAYTVPMIKTVPTLAEMSVGALNVLRQDPDGFFIMIEGGAIDWACHNNESGRLIEEQIDFNKAVDAVVKWVAQNSSWDDTLLLVTADHECGYLLGPGSDPDQKPLVNNGQGKMPGMEWYKTSHTNELVPLYVKGAGAAEFDNYFEGKDPVRGRYIHNTAIGKVMFALFR